MEDKSFELLVSRIRMLQMYERSLDEIHDTIMRDPGATEEIFFLAYKAALICKDDF